MALLVTGAMGHVGYETVKQAAGRGMSVVAQYLNTFREDDARAVGDGVVWVKCDLASAEDVAAMTEAHDIDGCIHTAAIPNDKMGLPRPDDTFLSNVRAPQLLLESARQQNWRRFIQVSTGSVFQALPDATTPVTEDLPPSPRTLYGCTKHSAELMAEAYANSYGVSACTVRISWIFGPPLVPKIFDGPRGPIPEFLRRVFQGEKIDEPEGGDFAASFTYVKDCALGLLAIYEAERLNHTVYHLGSSRNQTTYEVAKAIEAVVPGAEISVGPGTEPWTSYTILRGPLSCQRMKEDFGFEPTYSLEAAIGDFAAWMRQNPESFTEQGE